LATLTNTLHSHLPLTDNRYWLSSVFNPQVLSLEHNGTRGFMNWRNPYVRSKIPVTLALRALYIALNVVAPFLHHGLSSWAPLAHIWVLSTTESLFLAGLFALSHNFELSDRDPKHFFKKSGGDAEEKQPVCWYKAQVETSCTYGGWVAGALTGGLNFQIEHHLFPRMSSAWYPTIQPVVQKICAKHGVRYRYFPHIHQNFLSMLRYMHEAGTGCGKRALLSPLAGGGA
jgi:fatty acid desaturase (delta-4 desaturase)